jgi:uncharacterized secreted protein with C-terminal beta-propeller domain
MKKRKKFLSIFFFGLAIIILAGLIFIAIRNSNIVISSDNLKTFSSYEEMNSYLKEKTAESLSDYLSEFGRGVGIASTAESAGASEYSTTNIQVEGVDEPDIVKNDGKYIYTVSGEKVVIVEAYPASEMKILSEIDVNKSVVNIFLNGDNLVIFSEGTDYALYPYETCVEMKSSINDEGGCGGYYDSKSLVQIYDIKDRENPALEKEITLEGSYNDARMIGDYVYAISKEYIYTNNFIRPYYSVGDVKTEIPIDDIYYFDVEDDSYVFTIVSAINLDNNEINNKVYLIGYSSEMYVSQNNVYLTHLKTISSKDYQNEFIEEVYLPLLPENEKEKIEEIKNSDKTGWEKWNDISEVVMNYSDSLTGEEKSQFDESLMKRMQDFEVKIQKEYEKTVIHKINIDGSEITYKNSGEVPGDLLNQFSMDEFDGNFRIATTTGQVSRSGESTSLNHLFVLNEELNIIGSVEDLAPGERIYSTRFLGNRAYIVTFKKVDPLFVIDLSNPTDPQVLGYLKITGYSDYLHPYDENHVIGIGKETAGGDEHFSWYQGIKISLFDVSDVENPTEVGKIVIGDRGTDSYALYDHKAFLFDKTKNLIVIPVMLAEINKSKYRECNESELEDYYRWEYCLTDHTYGEYVWQGAYVLNINLDDGISLRGKITHKDNETVESGFRYYYYDKYSVKRSLYMDDILYTISDGKVKANNLETVEEISKVELPYSQAYDNYYYDY